MTATTIRQNQRAQRIILQERVLVSFGEKAGFIGMTHDISQSGSLIITDYKPPGICVGGRGTIRSMPLTNGKQELSCQVVRITDQGVAVTFLNL
jgi:hypothetical protein